MSLPIEFKTLETAWGDFEVRASLRLYCAQALARPSMASMKCPPSEDDIKKALYNKLVDYLFSLLKEELYK